MRVIVWNAFLVLCMLILVAASGEVYFRLSMPFTHSTRTSGMVFVPDVGILYRPNDVVRFTNHLDFWTESIANSLGFLDREPPNSQRAEESCHVAIIGDSFVEAKQVPLASRFAVLLESLANRSLPGLDVTTSAFGRSSSGQIHQLPFYDYYAKNMHPEFLVLSFDLSDFHNNLSFLHNLRRQWDPDHPPHWFAQRSKTGELYLRPPDLDFKSYMIATPPPPQAKIST